MSASLASYIKQYAIVCIWSYNDGVACTVFIRCLHSTITVRSSHSSSIHDFSIMDGGHHISSRIPSTAPQIRKNGLHTFALTASSFNFRFFLPIFLMFLTSFPSFFSLLLSQSISLLLDCRKTLPDRSQLDGLHMGTTVGRLLLTLPLSPVFEKGQSNSAVFRSRTSKPHCFAYKSNASSSLCTPKPVSTNPLAPSTKTFISFWFNFPDFLASSSTFFLMLFAACILSSLMCPSFT
mmetsp:Transcript_1706/g.2331  ORF Transcript_1706/g.2331 Transcript_1706/m.2331 type:complete len:236 (+) Transcript_1706:606-1313(+)